MLSEKVILPKGVSKFEQQKGETNKLNSMTSECLIFLKFLLKLFFKVKKNKTLVKLKNFHSKQIPLNKCFLTFFAPWTPKSKKKYPLTPKLSKCTTGGPLNTCKRGLKG